MTRILTIGGGTGTYTVLSGIKKQSHWDAIGAIVAVTDSGGSTGRLRDEFGYLPVGDFRMALAALAGSNDNNILRDLFLYRFEKGSGLAGHNFGNLFLVAMTDILGSEEKAIEYASTVLNVAGDVYPVSTDTLTLACEYSDGSVVRGETFIDEPEHVEQKRIEHLWIEPATEIDAHAKEAIFEADCIVLGPGDLYTSTLACVVVPGVAEALKETDAQIIYVMNLMTKFGQTDTFTAQDYVDELTRYIGKRPDHVIVNNAPLPADIINAYKEENDFPVEDDLSQEPYVIREDVVATEKIEKSSGDTLKRSLLRHDSDKLATVLKNICSK